MIADTTYVGIKCVHVRTTSGTVPAPVPKQ